MSRPSLNTVVRARFSRRDLVKAGPLVAVAAGAVGLGVCGDKAEALVHTDGTCRFCLMHCGITTEVRGTHLVKVEGRLASRTRGFLCEHGFALREVVHSHERLQQPLIRRGDAFHEVSWPEALAEVARRLEAVKRAHGPEAFVIRTGWPLVRHPLVNFLHRFARAFGSPNVATVSSLCEASLRMGQALTVGSKYSPDLHQTKTLCVWGANPPTSAPPFAHLVSAKATTGTLIVVDPIKTNLAKEATLHLQVRPGFDGALALGMVNVVISEGLYDAAFVAQQTIGFEALKALAMQYPLARTEQLTSVPAESIARAARALATQGPSGIWAGLGVEHHENGVQAIRAIASLEALCGRWNGQQSPRTVVSPMHEDFFSQMLPALYDMKTPEPVPPAPRARALGHGAFPLFEMYNREAQGELLADAILDDTPYPVRALMLVASNALITSQGGARLEKAFDALEVVVVVDPFFTASAQRADIVLPSTTFAESLDVDDADAVARGTLVPVQHGARPDFTILTELARVMGLGHYFPWQNLHEAISAPHVPWMTDPRSQPLPRPETATPTFGTLSGKAEFTSRLLPEFGHPALPEFTAPTEPLTPEFPVRLITGPRPRAYINSQFRGAPSIKARMREAEVMMHPQVAARFEVTHNQLVMLVSPHGRLTLRAVVTADVHPECVVISAGWATANANRLISPDKRDPISGFPAFRSGVCRVEPATPATPATE